MTREQAGKILHDKRLSLGFSVDDVAKATLLKKQMLESLESGGPVMINGFVKSYVRRYADYLGLDGDTIVAAFSEISEESKIVTAMALKEEKLKDQERQTQPEHVPSIAGSPAYRRKRGPFLYILAAVVVLTVAIVLLAHPLSTITPTPSVASPSSISPSVASPSVVSQPSTVTPVTPSTSTPSTPSAVVSPVAGQLTLRFAATTKRTWLEITADGQVVFSGVLRPGDSTPDITGSNILVSFGNAMYTKVYVNGNDQGMVSTSETVITGKEYSASGTP